MNKTVSYVASSETDFTLDESDFPVLKFDETDDEELEENDYEKLKFDYNILEVILNNNVMRLIKDGDLNDLESVASYVENNISLNVTCDDITNLERYLGPDYFKYLPIRFAEEDIPERQNYVDLALYQSKISDIAKINFTDREIFRINLNKYLRVSNLKHLTIKNVLKGKKQLFSKQVLMVKKTKTFVSFLGVRHINRLLSLFSFFGKDTFAILERYNAHLQFFKRSNTSIMILALESDSNTDIARYEKFCYQATLEIQTHEADLYMIANSSIRSSYRIKDLRLGTLKVMDFSFVQQSFLEEFYDRKRNHIHASYDIVISKEDRKSTILLVSSQAQNRLIARSASDIQNRWSTFTIYAHIFRIGLQPSCRCSCPSGVHTCEVPKTENIDGEYRKIRTNSFGETFSINSKSFEKVSLRHKAYALSKKSSYKISAAELNFWDSDEYIKLICS